jgi:hypothetical protein
MGVHSTLNVSRQAALKTLRKAISDDNISDETVDRLINAFLYPHLYNVSLVTDGKGSDDDTVLDFVD